jgi:hypothetical protein
MRPRSSSSWGGVAWAHEHLVPRRIEVRPRRRACSAPARGYRATRQAPLPRGSLPSCRSPPPIGARDGRSISCAFTPIRCRKQALSRTPVRVSEPRRNAWHGVQWAWAILTTALRSSIPTSFGTWTKVAPSCTRTPLASLGPGRLSARRRRSRCSRRPAFEDPTEGRCRGQGNRGAVARAQLGGLGETTSETPHGVGFSPVNVRVYSRVSVAVSGSMKVVAVPVSEEEGESAALPPHAARKPVANKARPAASTATRFMEWSLRLGNSGSDTDFCQGFSVPTLLQVRGESGLESVPSRSRFPDVSLSARRPGEQCWIARAAGWRALSGARRRRSPARPGGSRRRSGKREPTRGLEPRTPSLRGKDE